MVKQLRQVVGVQRVQVVDFKKGVFAIIPRPGARLSESALMQAARKSGFTPDRVVAPGGTVTSAPVLPPDARELARIREQMARELLTARQAFRSGDYAQALKLAQQLASEPVGDVPDTKTSAAKKPAVENGSGKDAPDGATGRSAEMRRGEIQQFLSLVTFSLGRYDDAFEAAHTALHSVRPWDWKMLSGHYAKSDVYVAQLRELERSIRVKPTATKRFLIGYHYWMMGHHASARTQLTKAAAASDDKLIPELLKQLNETLEQRNRKETGQ